MAAAGAKHMVELGLFRDPSQDIDLTACTCDGPTGSASCLYGWCYICDYPDLCSGNHGNRVDLGGLDFSPPPLPTPMATPEIIDLTPPTEGDDDDVVELDGRTAPPPPPVMGPGQKRKSESSRSRKKKVPKKRVSLYPDFRIPVDVIALKVAIRETVLDYPGEEKGLINYLFSDLLNL